MYVKDLCSKISLFSQSDLFAKDLAKYDINGRQIKTTVRLAQALAKSESQQGEKEI